MPITALGFLAVFSIGCLVALKRPYVGLLLYFFVYYMHPPGKYWGSFLPEMRWTLIVALITLVSTFMHEKELGKWFASKQSKLLFLFFIFILVQYPFVISKTWHIEFVILFFKMFILYFLIVTLTNSIKKFSGLIITNLIGVAYIGFTALQTHSSGRFEAAGLPSINDSNLMGIHAIPILFLGGFFFLSQKKKQRFWLLVPLLFTANLIIMTGSRGAMLATALAGIITLYFAPKMMKGQLYKWAAIVLVGFSFASADLIIQRFETTLAEDSNQIAEKSAESRIVIIDAQLEMFKEHFLLGRGHRTTLLLSPYYISEEYMTQTKSGALRGSHNLTLSVLNDHGLIGFLLFLIIILSCLKQLIAIKNSNTASSLEKHLATGLIAGFFGFLIASQFSNSKVLEIYIWLIAFSVSFIKLATREDNKHE